MSGKTRNELQQEIAELKAQLDNARVSTPRRAATPAGLRMTAKATVILTKTVNVPTTHIRDAKRKAQGALLDSIDKVLGKTEAFDVQLADMAEAQICKK